MATENNDNKKGYLERAADMLKSKRNLNWLLLFLFALIEIVVLTLMAFTLIDYLKTDTRGIGISHLVSIELILLWVGVIIGFYGWSIYFYNINFGLTNQDWFEIREKTAKGEEVKVPSENPHTEETLGLPKGTVRGTIALTVLIGGLSMTIYSFGLGAEYQNDSMIVDHLDFFKTAFLMVIAFYFGNKSLETMGYKSQSANRGRDSSESEV
jgi:hypothetical protein